MPNGDPIDARRIPRPTARRLSLYLRELEARPLSDRKTVSSGQLARNLGLTDAQVRKDLAHFGQFGQAGIGYRYDDLVDRLREIIGTNRTWTCVVVGAGNIGRAVTLYERLEGKGFRIVDVYDAAEPVVGTEIAGHRVRSIDELADRVKDAKVDLGILAVPAAAAQEVARVLVDGGVRGILNFAPVHLEVATKIPIVSVDLTVALELLAFKVTFGMSGTSDSFE